MDHPDLTVSNLNGNFIGLKRVKKLTILTGFKNATLAFCDIFQI